MHDEPQEPPRNHSEEATGEPTGQAPTAGEFEQAPGLPASESSPAVEVQDAGEPSTPDPAPSVLAEAADSDELSPIPETPATEASVPSPAVAPDAAQAQPAAPEVAEAEPEVSAGPLEDLELPSSVQTLEPLPEGAPADPAGTVVVERLHERRGRVNTYLASRKDESGELQPVELREGPLDAAGLQREAAVLSDVRYSMLPTLYASWEHDGRRYLALERVEGPTLGEALEAGMTADQVVSVVLQLAQVLRRLHGAGWALTTLSPATVRVGQPLHIIQLGGAVRIGEEPEEALLVPGYSAPELAYRGEVSGKEDVYTLAAVLHRGLSGEPLPEQGPELAALANAVQTPGGPQLLASAFAPADERVDLEAFYRQLLAFKRRLSLAPLALRIASGTTLGLNQTRLVNEDAGGYLTWCSAYEGRVAYNAVLAAIDGMGGMEAGEVASTAALRAVLRRTAAYSAQQIGSVQGSDLDAPTPGGPEAQSGPGPLNPRDLVQAAAEAVYAAASGRQVGATITCAVVEDGRLTLAHVGDTRAYLLRDGVLTQLTRDHSLVAAMVASGMITKEEARGHPESNKVLRSLGGQRSLPDEYIDGLEAAFGEDVLQLRDGDQLLLCSDGVWGVLDDDALAQVLSEAVDCETAVRIIIRRVLEGGAPDNATVLVARCLVMPAS